MINKINKNKNNIRGFVQYSYNAATAAMNVEIEDKKNNIVQYLHYTAIAAMPSSLKSGNVRVRISKKTLI